MNKHLILSSLALGMVAIFSCKKSDLPDNSPKWLVAIWFDKGQANQSGFKFEYDQQGRIVKRSFAMDPTNYDTWTYNGDQLSSHKSYEKGKLVSDPDNSFSSSQGSITENYPLKDGTGKVVSTYHEIFDTASSSITQAVYRTEVIPSPLLVESVIFQYAGDDLASITDRTTQDGAQYFADNKVVIKAVDSHPNPFFEMGPVNQTLTTYGDHWLTKGRHNVTSVEGNQFGSYPHTGNFTWTYDADGYPKSLRLVGSSVDVVTYEYSR